MVQAPQVTGHELRHDLQAAGRADSLWPGQAAIAGTLALYFALPPKLMPGPGRLLPILEVALLAALVLGSLARGGKATERGKALVFVLLGAVTLTNLVSLGLLIHYVLIGGHARGTDLIGGGVVIWCTNLLVFAVWFWELDRGGPQPISDEARYPDLLFPQMSDDAPGRFAPAGWRPHFGDYLYVSLTNQAAFSPTDTMPLTPRLKLLMAVQSVASLITVGVLISRAVNILTS